MSVYQYDLVVTMIHNTYLTIKYYYDSWLYLRKITVVTTCFEFVLESAVRVNDEHDIDDECHEQD